MTIRTLVLLATLGWAPDRAAAQADITGPLAELHGLVGVTWQAQGSGFSTTLGYRWLFEGRLLEGTNEVRNAEGRVIARYWGAYAWDAGRNRIEFWTAAESGEVHRGHAWWQDGALWHEAEVSGGNIDGYRSAVLPRDGRLEYYAVYGKGRTGARLLETEPIIYVATGAERPDSARSPFPPAARPPRPSPR